MTQRAQVEEAQRLNPGVKFRQEDKLGLDIEHGAWGGIVAFYCVIHLPRTEINAALAKMKRALRPGSLLPLAFHVGEKMVRSTNGGDSPSTWTFASSIPWR
jgi:SAM-dependent methyltransferase